MNIPLLGTVDFKDWLRGLIGGFIAGGASAVTSGPTLSMVDPSHFNIHTAEFYEAVGAIFMANGVVGAMLYLAKNPVPEMKTTTLTSQQTTTTPSGKVVETRMEQKVVEPAPKTEPVAPAGENK